MNVCLLQKKLIKEKCKDHTNKKIKKGDMWGSFTFHEKSFNVLSLCSNHV